jgi:hypothetical protein
MRRLTVLILPLQLAFPGVGGIIKNDERFDGGVERKASRKWEDAEEKRTKKDRNIIWERQRKKDKERKVCQRDNMEKRDRKILGETER